MLAKKLSQRADPVSTFLWERLDKPSQEVLANANESSSKEDVERILVAVLNDVMQGECIFDKERFQGVPLRSLTRGFLKEVMVGSLKDNPVGKNSMFLNRWLLEDAYPNELEKLPNLVVDLRPNQPMPAKFKEKLENTVRKARSQLEEHAIPSDKKIVLLIINRDLPCMALRIKEIEGALQQPDVEVVCQIGDM